MYNSQVPHGHGGAWYEFSYLCVVRVPIIQNQIQVKRDSSEMIATAATDRPSRVDRKSCCAVMSLTEYGGSAFAPSLPTKWKPFLVAVFIARSRRHLKLCLQPLAYI